MNKDMIMKYVNKWVALTADRTKILAYAEDIKKLNDKVRKIKSKPDVIYHYVLPIKGNYAPQCQK